MDGVVGNQAFLPQQNCIVSYRSLRKVDHVIVGLVSLQNLIPTYGDATVSEGKKNLSTWY